jgi:hypothetical protein
MAMQHHRAFGALLIAVGIGCHSSSAPTQAKAGSPTMGFAACSP